MKNLKTGLILIVIILMILPLNGCDSKSPESNKKIIRIAHMQSESHPEHIGLETFKKIIEEKLGDKYEVEIYPNELLGTANKMIELCQTGAIDFVVVGTANLESFANVYEIFSMPYLFTSEEAYRETMNDREFMESIYETTKDSGFQGLTWFNAGSRSFYATRPIYTPADLKGLKIRVQQSPASVAMVNAFGAAASPMSFGEVYTAIQQGVIDGAENNELALTNNKHGEVAKYYSYNRHQMIPDLLIASTKFLDSLDEDEYQFFMDAAYEATAVELKEWDKAVEESKKYSIEKQGVEFIDVDIEPFRQAVLGLQQTMIEENPNIIDLYSHIQEINEKVASESKGDS